MILQQPLERASPGLALRATSGVTRDLDTSSPLRGAVPMSTKRRLEEEQEPLSKQFLSENMATHYFQLSLHNDHPYCSPPMTFPPALPPLRSPHSELLLWQYPGKPDPRGPQAVEARGYPQSPLCCNPSWGHNQALSIGGQ